MGCQKFENTHFEKNKGELATQTKFLIGDSQEKR